MERSGIHPTGKDSGWPTGSSNEPDPHKDGSGKDDHPKVTAVEAGKVVAEVEEQRVTDSGGDAGTTFTLSFKGQTTTPLNKDTATGDQVETALVALSNIAPADINVTGPAGGPWDVRFLEDGAYGDEDVAAITGTGVSVNEVQTGTMSGAPTGGTFKLSFGGQQTTAIGKGATGAEIQTAMRALSSIADDEITVTGGAGGPHTYTFAAGLGGKDVAAITVDNSGLTGGTAPAYAITTGTPGKTGPTVTVSTLVDG